MLRKIVGVALAIAFLAGGVVVARELTRPASVTIEEPSITLEPGEMRSIHASRSGGSPFSDALSWRILPAGLGTINERGEFRAGAVSGKGTVSARSGSASANVPITITCPKQAQLRGVRFDVACGRLADVYVDVAAYGGAASAATAVDRDASTVSSDLSIPPERRFRVYYFGTSQGFAAAVPELGRDFTSGGIGFEGGAVYFDAADAIAIDQSADPQMQTTGALRHELVHRFLRQFVGYANVNEIPTWLNEGWAFVEESSQKNWLRMEARLVSASMAHLGKLPSLRTLTSLGDWNDRTGIESLYQYYAAAQAAQFLIDDAKLAGMHRLLLRVRDGSSFAEAFAYAVPGLGYADFQDRFNDRVAALVQTYPGMVAVSGAPNGSGGTVIVYGLNPSASATVTAAGPIERELSTTIDPYGVYVKYIGREFPPGDYIVTFETAGQHLSVTLRL